MRVKIPARRGSYSTASRYTGCTLKKPNIAKPRSASGAFSLSRKLPKLKLPDSAAAATPPRAKPQVGRPGKSLFGKRS